MRGCRRVNAGPESPESLHAAAHRLVLLLCLHTEQLSRIVVCHMRGAHPWAGMARRRYQ